ncbi:hypothetical protein E1281_25940 [Actinomadura sp. KC345]|uniref:hypothetical protein n=1 Tax=Actinomadura sp. KC345 TaxID=2530371 RepID=UPI00104FCC15|nr:hypothetical protein [Actinomadura sp. KC345]TDC47645.1 hypothetical protein E1281_25940 [Actinomadura sp. KC345]
MEALGRTIDIVPGVVPVDLGTAASTGKRVGLKNATGVTVVGFLNNGTAAQAPTFTLQEHTAASGGTSQNLAVIDHYYVKEEAALDGDETWTKVTQAAAATITDADWDDANQVLVAFEVHASQLSDGYTHISCNVSDPGTAQVGAVLYVLHDLAHQRAPESLPNPQA